MSNLETHKQVVIDTMELLRNGWCKGTFARDNNDEAVHWSAPEARYFCLGGALRKVVFESQSQFIPYPTNFVCLSPIYKDIGFLLHIKLHGGVVQIWNDKEERKLEDVLSLLSEVLSDIDQELLVKS